MAVSSNHMNLVIALKEYVQEAYGAKGKLILYTDNPDTIGQGQIPKIGEAYPDLYARCHNPDFIVLGEAKTVNDVDNSHSRKQYEQYLKYCSEKPNRELIFAVPWTVVPCLKNIIRILKRHLQIDNVYPHYIEPLPE